MNPASWRTRMLPVAEKILEANPGADPKTLRKAFRDGFPYPPRRQWVYKVWRSIVRELTGLAKAKRAAEQDSRAVLFNPDGVDRCKPRKKKRSRTSPAPSSRTRSG